MHEGGLSDAPIQARDSRSSILALLQHHVQELDRSHSDDWLKWPELRVNILYALSETRHRWSSQIVNTSSVASLDRMPKSEGTGRRDPMGEEPSERARNRMFWKVSAWKEYH